MCACTDIFAQPYMHSALKERKGNCPVLLCKTAVDMIYTVYAIYLRCDMLLPERECISYRKQRLYRMYGVHISHEQSEYIAKIIPTKGIIV